MTMKSISTSKWNQTVEQIKEDACRCQRSSQPWDLKTICWKVWGHSTNSHSKTVRGAFENPPYSDTNFPRMQQEPCWMPEAGKNQMAVPLKGRFSNGQVWICRPLPFIQPTPSSNLFLSHPAVQQVGSVAVSVSDILPRWPSWRSESPPGPWSPAAVSAPRPAETAQG